MAEENEDIDGLFRERMSGHTETPSLRAWTKLEKRLSRKKKGMFLPWMRIAASILLVISLVSLVWFSFRSTENQFPAIVVKDPVPEKGDGREPETQPLKEKLVLVEKKGERSSNQPIEKTQRQPKKQADHKNQVLEKIPDENKKAQLKEQSPIDVGTLDLTPFEVDLMIADNGLAGQKKTEVAYKITIISNGLTERPVKENLVNEIENKIGQLGNLLSKVDQGFSDLQDAKNSLFSTITSRKEPEKN